MKHLILIIGIILCSDAIALEKAELAATLAEARVRMDLPGVRAAVRFDDGTMVLAADGYADVEAQVPLDNTIGMPGGSTGKTFVAALTMLLVQDGVLSLDDPASRWLGGQRWFQRVPNADKIRVRHLLAHTSGLADYPATAGFQAAMIWRVVRHGSAYFTPEDLIGYIDNRRPSFQPGKGYRYTDAGYLVLGRLIEAATGRAYFELLDERILIPNKLDHIRPQIQSALPRIATGYMAGSRNLKDDGRMKFDPRSEWTGGGLVTTPAMLASFFAALAEGRIVDTSGVKQMLDGGWHDPAKPESRYGFGVFIWDEGRTFGHSGLWPGYRSFVKHALDTGTTIAVQTNRDGRVDLEDLANRLFSLADN